MNRYRSIILSALFALAIVLGLLAFLDSQDSLKQISQLPLSIWITLLLITTVHLILRFYRWCLLLFASFEVQVISKIELCALYVSGFALTLVPSKLGENVRSIFLKERGVPYSASITVFFIERFLDVAAVSLLALAYFAPARAVNMTQALLSLVGALVAATIVLQWMPLTFFSHPRLEQIKLALISLRSISTTTRVEVLVLSFLAWWIQSLSLWIVLYALSEPVSVIVTSAIYSMSLLAGAVSMMPGGLGVTELTAAYSLEQSGVEFNSALLAMTITRFTTLWYAMFLGIIGYSYCTKKAHLSVGQG